MTNPKLRFKQEVGVSFPDWKERNLAEILSVKHGRDYKGLPVGNIPVLGTGGQIAKVGKALCDWPCVLIGRKGTINKPQFMSEPFWSVDTLFYTKPVGENSPKFQYYLFQTIDWMKYNEASGVPSLSATTVEAIPKAIPTIPEQQKVADFFTALDEKIALAERKLNALQTLKSGLMQKIFSQEIRFKREDGSNYPGWTLKNLGDVCSTFKSGVSITSKQIFEEGQYAVYGGNGLRGYTSRYTHDGEFLLVGRQGALCGNVRIVTGRNFISEHAIAIQTDQDSSTRWLLYLLDWMDLNKLSESSAQPGLSVSKLVNIQCKIPCLQEQQKIAQGLSCVDKKIGLCEQTLDQLKMQKQAFLQQMFV